MPLPRPGWQCTFVPANLAQVLLPRPYIMAMPWEQQAVLVYEVGLVDVLIDEIVDTVARSRGGSGICTGRLCVHAQRGMGIVEALGFRHVAPGAANEELGRIADGPGRLGAKDREHVPFIGCLALLDYLLEAQGGRWDWLRDGASIGEDGKPQKGELG